MAEIDIKPLDERFSDEEIAELAGAMEKIGAPQLPQAAEDSSASFGEGLDDDVVVEFLDRLEVHDMACELYLPVEFEGRIEAVGLRIGSSQALLEVLDEMRDELFIEDEEEDEDLDEEDEEDEYEEDERDIMDAKLKQIWKLLYAGATASVERHLPLHIKS